MGANKLKFPDGCVCEKWSWCNADKVSKICDAFTANPECDFKGCKNCEHDEGCHKNKTADGDVL